MNKTSAVEVKIQPVLAPFSSCADEIDGATKSARLKINFRFAISLIIFVVPL